MDATDEGSLPMPAVPTRRCYPRRKDIVLLPIGWWWGCVMNPVIGIIVYLIYFTSLLIVPPPNLMSPFIRLVEDVKFTLPIYTKNKLRLRIYFLLSCSLFRERRRVRALNADYYR